MIPQVAVDNGLTTLATAVEAAELDDDLSTAGPFTVFAPTNDAFAALGTTLNDLLLPANQATLVDILTYHVIDGAAGKASAAGSATSLEGDAITITADVGAETVSISGAGLTAFNVPTDNGIVHVVDTVLLPPTLVLKVNN